MNKEIKKLKQQLKLLEQQKESLMQEKSGLIENIFVKRYIRLEFEERRLEREIYSLIDKIDEEIMISCHHAFINIDKDDNKYCVKFELSTESSIDKKIKIYEETKQNSTIINSDYICDKKVVETVGRIIALKYPYISEDEFVHYFAVAIHNMQTKKKSEKIKRDRAKRLYIRPVFLKRSNML